MDTSRLSVASLPLSRDLKTAFRKVRELGLRGVELDLRTGLSPEQLSQTGIRQIRKWLADEGLVVVTAAFPTRGGYTDVERLEGRIAATKSALETAHALGATVLLNHVGDIPPPTAADAPADPRWQLLIDVLTDVGAWGERVGCTLSAEAGRSSPADLARVIAGVPDGSLLCHVVTGSLVVHGHDPVAAVEMLSSHIGHVHATDAIRGAFKGRGRAVILGSGEVDLPNVLATLEERAYRGWIGLEPVDGFQAEAELADAITSLQAL
ncbi:MAG: sugar phosphate isomerase/epimerase family protein [Planctomycetia bacterium]